MKTYSFGIITILVLLVAGGGMYYTNRINNLNSKLMESQSIVRVVSDSLHTVNTAHGQLIWGYASLQHITDSLKLLSFYKDRQIYTEQNTIASLRAQLSHGTDTLYANSDTVIGTTFYNSYKDTGLAVNISDSVLFRRIKSLTWVGENNPTFSATLSLRNTIGRNKDGTFYGSVESFSPQIKIDNVKTIVDDKYIPVVAKRVPTTFAVGGSLDNNTVSAGLRLRFGNWQVGGEYILISSPVLTGTLTRVRGSLYYFLF